MFAVRLVLIYGSCAALWIFLSDQALRRLTPDAQLGLILQTYKGWGFVVVTSCLLFIAARAQLRRWEAEFRRSEQRYRELMEQAADGIHLLDKEGNFLLANSAMSDMLGYSPEELLRMNIVDTYPDELRHEGRRRLSEVTAGKVVRFERIAMRKNGTSLPVESAVMALADGSIQGITRDMTDRKRRRRPSSAARASTGRCSSAPTCPSGRKISASCGPPSKRSRRRVSAISAPGWRRIPIFCSPRWQ